MKPMPIELQIAVRLPIIIAALFSYIQKPKRNGCRIILIIDILLLHTHAGTGTSQKCTASKNYKHSNFTPFIACVNFKFIVPFIYHVLSVSENLKWATDLSAIQPVYMPFDLFSIFQHTQECLWITIIHVIISNNNLLHRICATAKMVWTMKSSECGYLSYT